VHWWIDEPILMGSHNPSDCELDELLSNGVKTLVSLLERNSEKPAYDLAPFESGTLTRISMPVRDFSVPTLDQLEEFIELVRTHGERGTVLVHCQGGAGRTGTFGAAWLISVGFTAELALVSVRRANPGAIETVEQEKCIKEFYEVLREI
jgi:protein-tyrosine phosphatase